MSDRANYFLINNNTVTTYFDKNSIERVMRWLGSGQQETLADLVTLLPFAKTYGRLLDEVWCANALLVDDDSQQLKFFFTDLEIPLQKALSALVETAWPGWKVAWAHEGLSEMAHHIGVDPFLVRVNRGNWFQPPSAEALDYREPDSAIADPLTGEILYREKRWISAFVSTKERNSEVKDYSFYCSLQSLLSMGENLLVILNSKGADWLPLPDEGWNETYQERGDKVQSGAYIDLANKIISVWWQNPTDNSYLGKLSEFWPGWTVEQQCDGLAKQIELSGRSADEIRMTEQRARAILIEIHPELARNSLSGGESKDARS